MSAILRQQYAMVLRSRTILFDYLQQVLTPETLTQTFPAFNDKSIRGLLEHAAGCYFSWIGFHALGRPRTSFDHKPCTTMQDIRYLYQTVDEIIHTFFDTFADNINTPIKTQHDPGEWITANPLSLFTHTITHEFHHKGQIVWLCRLMGHTPTDTDASNCFDWAHS